MRAFGLLILLLAGLEVSASPPVPPSELAMTRFQERRFNEAIPLFQQAVSANPDDDSARYHLALAQAQAGKSEEALQSLAALIRKDPAFYLYRAEFDRDFEKVVALAPFTALKAQYSPYFLAVDPATNDRVSLEADGPYLFHQGAKIPLIRPLAELVGPGAPEALIRRPQAQYKARFIGRDTVLVSWSEVVEKDQIRSGLSLFSKKTRQSLPVWEGDGPVDQFYVNPSKPHPLLVLQLDKNFSVYEVKGQHAPLLATYEGRIQAFNEQQGRIQYVIPPAKTPKNKPAPEPEIKTVELAALLEGGQTLPPDGL